MFNTAVVHFKMSRGIPKVFAAEPKAMGHAEEKVIDLYRAVSRVDFLAA